MGDERAHLLRRIRRLVHLAGKDEQAAKDEFNLLHRKHDRAELAAATATVINEYADSLGI